MIWMPEALPSGKCGRTVKLKHSPQCSTNIKNDWRYRSIHAVRIQGVKRTNSTVSFCSGALNVRGIKSAESHLNIHYLTVNRPITFRIKRTCVIRIMLRTNSDCFLIQQQQVGLWNVDKVCASLR
jgi:hypothetical protein